MSTSYRITSPYRHTVCVEPARLTEADFVRWGENQQNAKLKMPVTVHLANGSTEVYPVNAYIRIYETISSIHLISKWPLP